MKERIQKLLSRAGYGSRREIERSIAAGEILVNGQPATVGQAVDEHDQISMRGQRLHLGSRLNATPKVLMYNKPAGEVCTQHDPDGRKTVFEALPTIRAGRWIMIGRLDINTDGLLLFTTDGELANKLMHPSSEVEREYAVRVLGQVDNEMLIRLQEGVELDDGKASFLRIIDAGGEGANHWYHVVLAEGRNREVRRLWESQGVKVSRLIRVRYGNIELPRYLRTGHHKELEVRDLRKLYESVGLFFDDGSTFTPDKPHATRRTSAKPMVQNRTTASGLRAGLQGRPTPRGKPPAGVPSSRPRGGRPNGGNHSR